MYLKMIAIKFISIVLCMLLLKAETEIWIDQKDGTDKKSCLFDNQVACQSLTYVLDEITKNLTFVNVSIVIKRDFILYKPVYINKASVNLLNIIIRGKANETKIIANVSDANINVGNKNQPFLGYKIEFLNLNFQGFKKNATSVIVGWSADLVLRNCIFKNNKCSALNLLNCYIRVENTQFENNWGNSIAKGQVYGKHETFPDGPNSAAGAVAVVFTQRKIPFQAIFINNTFKSNRAVTVSSKVVIDSDENSIAFSHVGGAILFAFMDDTSYIQVHIQCNTFQSNSASLGGGLMFTFHDSSGQNTITLLDNEINQNIATISGGGFAFATWQYASSNALLVTNTRFKYNSAQVGGAGRILLQSVIMMSSLMPAIQMIRFNTVLFFKNQAASASALHLNYNLATGNKPGVPVIFTDVTLENHTTQIYTYSLQGPSAYTGVLLSNRIDLEFHGKNIFKYNEIESSVHISNAEFYIKGNVTFYKNSVQTSGGAMTMTDVSHLILYPNAELTFRDNYAPVQGGALFIKTVGFPDLVYKYNPSCFIQYFSQTDKKLPPSHWKVSVEFTQNGAGLKGAAIYSNTITPCIWDENPPFYSFGNALRWKGFKYEDNYLGCRSNGTSLHKDYNVDIATDTKDYKLMTPNEIEISPGEEMLFRMIGSDELNSSVYSVSVASVDRDSGMNLQKKYYVLKPNSKEELVLQYSLTDEEYKKVSIENKKLIKNIIFVDSTSSFISNTTVKIKVKKCSLGFVFKENKCACNVQPDNNIVRCENNTVYLKIGYWGYTDNQGNFYTRKCPTNYCYCNQTDKTKIGCAFHEHSQCTRGRTGILCGECLEGYGLDLMTYECVTCDGIHWAFVTLIIVAIATISVVILILWFNPKFSTLVRGILFFVQMLPYVCDANGNVNKIVLSVTGWLDVGGINSVPVKSCFMKNFNSLYAVLLGYLYPSLISLILLITYVLHKFYMITFRRSSPFQAFWILMVMMYKFLVETSLLLLCCIELHDKGHVFYLDGSVQCYKNMHLLVSIIAVLVLIVTVLPPPILVPLIVNGTVSVSPGISDALTQGLRKHVRWWWSVDFVRRILFISIYVFVVDLNLRQILFTISCVCTLSFQIHYQPYRNQLANAGETFLLFCLTLIVAIEPANYNWASSKSIVQSAILIAAGLYCLFITLYVWFTFFLKKCRARGYTQIDDDDIDSVGGNNGATYKENFQRRISGGSKHKRGSSPFFNNRKNKMKKAYSDLARVPTPAYTRSDLNDFM